MMRFAEDANYFMTTVHPANSMGEIQALLDDFGATSINTMTGQNGDKVVWMIRFRWLDKTYRFTFTPLNCRAPEKVLTVAGKKRSALDQSKYQMGRIAVYCVKAILTAAEAMPAALFGFAELAVTNDQGMPATVYELNIDGLTRALPDLTLRALGAGE